MKNNMSSEIAASMDAALKSPEFTNMFSTSAVLEKLAFKRVADENEITEIEQEFVIELDDQTLQAVASDEAKADCVACGKKRSGWNAAMGICKCSAADGCNPLTGCKDGCSCGCKTKKAGVDMSDALVKSAVNSILQASSDLEDAGFEQLSARALVLASNLVVEAKAKKMTKEEKAAAKEKEDAAKLKLKEKAEKLKAKERAEKDKNDAKDKKMKEKLKEELKADKAKKSGK